jgi:hypothetical protein
MKLMLLGPFIALVACCSAHAETKGYYFTPSDADVSYWCTYKFPSSVEGDVTSATLYVSPAGRPIWDTTLGLYGYECTTPLIGGPTGTYFSIGERYLNRNLQFGEYWGLDVTNFMRSVKSPYVQINISSENTYTRGAWLSVTTFIPEPSSFVYLAFGAGSLVIRRRRACAGSR